MPGPNDTQYWPQGYTPNVIPGQGGYRTAAPFYGRNEGVQAAGPPAPAGTPGLGVAPAALSPVPQQTSPATSPGFLSFLSQLFGGGQQAPTGMSAMLNRSNMNPNQAGRI